MASSNNNKQDSGEDPPNFKGDSPNISGDSVIFLNFNGTMVPEQEPILTASNLGFRYGEGLFETMRAVGGTIPLGIYHFARLFRGMKMLGLEASALSPVSITKQVASLCRINRHMEMARIRLTVFPDEREPRHAAYILQSSPFEDTGAPAGGLVLGVFPEARKSCDPFSNLKSSNYLIYSQAARYARSRGWADALVLNHRGHIADSSISNLFFVREGIIITPPLSEGCIEGVMRRLLLERLPSLGFNMREEAIDPDELCNAEEIFLTNALRGVRWVGEYAGRTYPAGIIHRLQDALKQYFTGL